MKLTADREQEKSSLLAPTARADQGRRSVKLHVIRRSQVVVTTSGFEPPYWLSDGGVGAGFVPFLPSCSPVIISDDHDGDDDYVLMMM